MSFEQPEPRDTERRRATVLFADITGFTSLVEQAGDEEAYGVVTECLKLLDAIARRHGATVDKYLGDCIMAVFGVPRAMEHAAREAVNAAIEMRLRVADFNREQRLERRLDVHTGICTGPLISGDVSGPVLREFAVMGDTVNIGARLKDLAPAGEIWVGHETWRETKDHFEYAPLQALEIKGKQKSVDVYEVRSPEPSLYDVRPGRRGDVHAELVGRDRELDALRTAVAAVAGGEGRIVTVVGEPGLGKSRLLAELTTATEGQNLTWLEGRALAIGTTLSYHPFQDLLRGWLGLEGESDDGEALARLASPLQELMGDEAAEALPFVATVLGLRLDAAGRRRLAAIQGDAREKMIHRALLRVGAALAERQPLWVALDDLQWADLSSIELLEALLPLCERHPVGFLLLCRPHFEETSERIRARAHELYPGRYSELELTPLGTEDSHRLIEGLFRGPPVPPGLRRQLLEKAAGNPFFTEEVVRALLDEGALEARDEGLVPTQRIHEVVIPGTIHEVIMARIDALGPDGRRVLEAASVMGGVFYRPILAEVVEKEELDEILARLGEAGLVALEERGEGRFRFRHPLIQEIAYRTLLRGARAELHGKVAEAMEAILTENVPGYHAMLAYHFSLGGDRERSQEYLIRAGDEAARSAASTEALRFFRDATRVYFEIHGEGGDPAQKSKLEKNVARALFNRGRLGEAVEHFDRALAHLGDRLPRGRTMYLHVAADLAGALRRLWSGGWEALPAANEREQEIVAIRFERALAQTTTAPEFVPDTISTLRRLSRVDPRSVPESGGILAGSIGIFSYGGISFRLGQRVLDVARQVAEAGNVQELLLYYRLMHFIHHFLQGDWSEQNFVDEALIEEGLRNGRFWEAAVALDLDGECALFRGDHARVERRLAQLRGLAEEYSHDVALSALRALGALLRMERGDLEAAVDEVELYRREHPDHTYQVAAHGMHASIEIRQGQLEAARESLARGEARIREAGLVPPFHRSFCIVPAYQLAVIELEAAQRAGQRGLARRLARRARRRRRGALAIARRVAARRTEILRAAATEAWLRGRYDRALRGYGQAVQVARELGARPELARTCAEIATRLAGESGPDLVEGRDAAAWRTEARELFDTLGLERERAALASPG